MEDRPLLINSADNTPIPINDTEFSIGHSPDCDYKVDAMSVSNLHCTIKKEGDKWILLNQSPNGTIINDELLYLNKWKELQSDDIIQIGNGSVEFIFQNPTDEAVLSSAFNNLTLIPVKESVNAVSVTTITSSSSETINDLNQSQNSDIIETDDVTCTICYELFIKAVTLNCSHTFCKVCIEQWKENKASCPTCRTKIKSQTSTLVLDSIIAKIMETRPSDVKSQRAKLIDQRNNLDKGTPLDGATSSASTTTTTGATTTTTTTVTIDLDNNDDDNLQFDNDDDIYLNFDNDDDNDLNFVNDDDNLQFVNDDDNLQFDNDDDHYLNFDNDDDNIQFVNDDDNLQFDNDDDNYLNFVNEDDNLQFVNDDDNLQFVNDDDNLQFVNDDDNLQFDNDDDHYLNFDNDDDNYLYLDDYQDDYD